MSAIRDRIETNERMESINQAAVWQADGLLIDAIEGDMSDAVIAHAARFWCDARERLSQSRLWREKIRPGDVEADDD